MVEKGWAPLKSPVVLHPSPSKLQQYNELIPASTKKILEVTPSTETPLGLLIVGIFDLFIMIRWSKPIMLLLIIRGLSVDQSVMNMNLHGIYLKMVLCVSWLVEWIVISNKMMIMMTSTTMMEIEHILKLWLSLTTN